MTGPLLKSGSLTAFHPVGAVGNPVYLAASQLRAAIARRLGAEVADTFAIPQRNEDGDAVDWYAPQQGRVVPWSAATDSEREDAQQRLLRVRTQIQDLGRNMEAEASPERQVFGRLLAQVMQFPDEDDVHLVNGQPVLTFWGFVKDRAAVGSDPLRSLDLHGATAGPSANGPSPARSRAWWLWPPLGLLLLLLALLGLRGCEFPSTTNNSEQATTSDETRQLTGNEPPADPSAPLMNGDLTREPLDEPTAESANDRVPSIGQVTKARDRVLVRDSEDVRIDNDTLIGRRDTAVTDTDRIDAEGTDEALLDSIATDGSTDTLVGDAVIDSDIEGVDGEGVLPVVPSGEGVVAEDDTAEGSVDTEAAADATGEEALAAEADTAGLPEPDAGSESSPEAGSEASSETAPDTAPDGTDGPGAADQAVVDPDASSDTAATEAETKAADEVNPSASAAEAPSSPDAEESIDRAGAGARDVDPTAAAAAAGAESGAGPKRTGSAPSVRIPPERLLNSSWRTSTTLSDPKDGSPVHLDYQLKDGAGKIRLTRRDGSVCESGADAEVQDGRLVVDSKSEIVCHDGTNFGRPQIDCTPRAGGKARCVGRYTDGSTFPIYMEQRAD